MCGLAWCTAKSKFTVILAWIQIFVYMTASCIVISAIFVTMLTDEGVQPANTSTYYSAMLAAVPVHLINEILMAVSLVPIKKEASPSIDERRISTLALCLSVLVFLLPAVVTGIYLLKGILQELSAVRTWTVLAVLFFALSIMEVVAGGYVNGIISMVIYAIAIWIVHKELRKKESLECQNRII